MPCCEARADEMSAGVLLVLYLNIFVLIGVVLRGVFSRLSWLIPYTVSSADAYPLTPTHLLQIRVLTLP